MPKATAITSSLASLKYGAGSAKFFWNWSNETSVDIWLHYNSCFHFPRKHIKLDHQVMLVFIRETSVDCLYVSL